MCIRTASGLVQNVTLVYSVICECNIAYVLVYNNITLFHYNNVLSSHSLFNMFSIIKEKVRVCFGVLHNIPFVDTMGEHQNALPPYSLRLVFSRGLRLLQRRGG